MAHLIGLLYLPGLAVIGAVLLLAGVFDRNYQGLAIGGCVLLGSVGIAMTPRARP